MPDLTAAFQKVFGALQSKIIQARPSDLRLYDDDGALIDTILSGDGWFPDELTPEQVGERMLEIHITDRDGIDFSAVTFFGIGGYKYERRGFANPPTGNPREWIWSAKAVGVDVVAADFIIDDAGNFVIDDAGNSLVTA